MAAKNTNPIYEFFERIDERLGKCKVCQKMVIADHGNTSNLKRHLEKHPSERQKFNDLKSQHDAKKRVKGDEKAFKANHTPTKQLKMEGFTRDFRSWETNDRRQKEGDAMLARMVCIDMQPVSVVEDTGFRAFVKSIQPSYQIPNRRLLTSTLIPKLYDNSVCEIKDKIQNCTSLSLTIDHWTSCANQGYMSVTGHFLSNDFSVNDLCLNVMPMAESHTAVNIADAVLNSVKTWAPEYEEKKILFFVISDNASNVQAALRQLPRPQFSGLGCFTHTLQLCINETIKGFPGLERVIIKAKNIVSHFHHSSQATHKLCEMQKLMKYPQHKLKQHCPTRWNSTYYLMERIVEQKEPLTAVLVSVDKVDNLQAHEWKTASSYVNVLRPFEGVTTMMSASRYATISMVIPVLGILIEKMKTTEMDSFGEKMTDNINKRWLDFESNELYSIASYLDPRFKEFAFSGDEGKTKASERVVNEMIAVHNSESKSSEKNNTVQSTLNESNTISADHSSESACANSFNSGSNVAAKSNKFDMWDTFKSMITKKQHCKSKEDTAATPASIVKSKMEHELELYCREELIEPSASPFDWWGRHVNTFPTLSKLAQVYLSIPATSVASERVFSKAGLIVSQRRSSMKPSYAEKLICLNHNLRC